MTEPTTIERRATDRRAAAMTATARHAAANLPRTVRRPAALAAAAAMAAAVLAAPGPVRAELPGSLELVVREQPEQLAGPAAPSFGAFPVQLVLDDGGAEGSVGVADGSGAREFLWFNRFDPPPGPGFVLEEVWVLFPADPNVAPGDAVELAVYQDADGDPTNGADLLATFDVTVQAADGATFSVYPLAAPVTFTGPGDVLIGAVPRFIEPGDPLTAPAAIDNTASQGRSWLAIWSGDPPDDPELPPDSVITTVDDLGFPGNWMIRGFGSEQPALEIPALGGAGLAGLAALLLLAGLVFLVRRRRAGVAVLAALALLPAAAARAQVVIDDFETAQGPLAVQVPPDAVGDTDSSSVAAGGGTVLGGQRDLLLRFLGGGGSGEQVSAEATGGELTFGADAGARGSLLTAWDGDTDPATVDPDGLGGVDLTAGGTQGGFRLAVASATFDVELQLEVHTDADNRSRASRVVPASGGVDVFIDFAELVPSPGAAGPADLTQAGAVTLRLLAESGAVTVSHFETAPPQVAAAQADFTDAGAPIGGGSVVPGETFRYRVTIANPGGGAEDVDLENLIDPNLVVGTFRTTPIVRNDHYTGFGNVTLTVDGVTLPGLTANDTDPDGDPIDIVAFDAVTVQGGAVALVDSEDGTFGYSPPPGFTGVDSFTYTVGPVAGDPTEDADGNPVGPFTATATIDLDRVVWFVDNTHGGPFEGTQANPFAALKDAETASGPGDVIRLRRGDGTTTGHDLGMVMKDGQHLIGGGVPLVLNGQTIEPADPGGRPQVTHGAGGHALELVSEHVIHGVDIVDSDQSGMHGVNIGSLEVRETSITGAGAEAMDIDGGDLDVELDSVSSDGSPTHGLRLANVTGTLTVSGSTTILDYGNVGGDGLVVTNSPGAALDFGTATIDGSAPLGGSGVLGTGGDGVSLVNNPGATITFDSLDVTSVSGAGLLADDAGTVNVNSTAATIDAGGGPAVDIRNGTAGQTNGVSGWTFQSLASDASLTEGVRLHGLTDGFTVGTGTTVTDAGTTGILVLGSPGIAFDFGAASVTDTSIGSGATANGVDLATGNAGATFTFDSLSVVADGGFGLRAANSGTVSVPGAASAIAATGGAAIDSTQTLLNAVFASLTSTGSAGQGVRVENGGASSVSVSGTTLVSSAGDAVRLAANAGATFSFGKLDLTTTAGAGLVAHSTGTVNVADATSTIAAVGGPAVDVNPTVLGVSLGTLSSTNSPSHGVSLQGASGSFSVAGTTTVTNAAGFGVRIVSSSAGLAFDDVTVNARNDTGIHVDGATGPSVAFGDVVVPNPNDAGGYGIRAVSSSAPITVASATISDPTITVAEVDANGDFVPENDGDGDAVFLKANTAKFTLNGGSLTDAGADGIDVRNSPAPDLADLLIENPGRDTAVNFGHGIQGIDLTGTGTVLRSTIRGFTQSGTDGLRVINTNTNLTLLTLDAVSMTNTCGATLPPSCGNDGVFLSSRGTSNLTLVVTDSDTGDAVPSRFAGLFGHAVQVNGADSAGSTGTANVTIENSRLENAKPGVGAAGGLNGVFLNTQFGATVNFTIQDNVIHDVARGNANGGIVQLNAQGGGSGTRTLTGTISGNVIENSTGRRGIAVDVDTGAGATGNTVVDVVIEDNDFNTFADREAFTGIFTDQGAVTHDVDLTFRDNRVGTCTNTVDPCTVGNVGGSRRAVLFQVLDSTTKTIDVLFEGNTINTNTSTDAVGVQVLDASNTFNFTGLGNDVVHGGSGTDALDVTLFDPGSIICVDLNAANVGADRNDFGKRYNLVHLDGTYRIEGLSGAQTAAAVLTFLDARNDGAAGAASTTGSFTGVASCPTP